jgi:hypothetical protein
MEEEPLWDGRDPEEHANRLLASYGIHNNPLGKKFQLIIHHLKDPSLIWGTIGSIQISSTWIELLFSPPMHTMIPQKVGSECVLRGVHGMTNEWIPLFSKWHVPFGEVYPAEQIYPNFPAIEFEIISP